MIHKNRGNRRDMTQKKAERKARIVHELGDYWSYKYFGQYRKGKIHCSCPRCAAKTNMSLNKSQGPVSSNTCRLSITGRRYGKNYTVSDTRMMDGLTYSLRDLALYPA